MKRSNSSHRWLEEHHRDNYVKLAKKQGMRSRAAFKLVELQEKYHLVKKGDVVVDLGAAPGSWSQLLVEWVAPQGKILALDILPMKPLPGVEFVQGDFTEEAVLQQLLQQVDERGVNVVVSDIAPNMSGIKAADQARAMYLAELALDFAEHHLIQGGIFLIKIFQGADFDAYVKKARQLFKKVTLYKPSASRDRSREVYMICLFYKHL